MPAAVQNRWMRRCRGPTPGLGDRPASANGRNGRNGRSPASVRVGVRSRSGTTGLRPLRRLAALLRATASSPPPLFSFAFPLAPQRSRRRSTPDNLTGLRQSEPETANRQPSTGSCGDAAPTITPCPFASSLPYFLLPYFSPPRPPRPTGRSFAAPAATASSGSRCRSRGTPPRASTSPGPCRSTARAGRPRSSPAARCTSPRRCRPMRPRQPARTSIAVAAGGTGRTCSRSTSATRCSPWTPRPAASGGERSRRPASRRCRGTAPTPTRPRRRSST